MFFFVAFGRILAFTGSRCSILWGLFADYAEKKRQGRALSLFAERLLFGDARNGDHADFGGSRAEQRVRQLVARRARGERIVDDENAFPLDGMSVFDVKTAFKIAFAVCGVLSLIGVVAWIFARESLENPKPRMRRLPKK